MNHTILPVERGRKHCGKLKARGKETLYSGYPFPTLPPDPEWIGKGGGIPLSFSPSPPIQPKQSVGVAGLSCDASQKLTRHGVCTVVTSATDYRNAPRSPRRETLACRELPSFTPGMGSVSDGLVAPPIPYFVRTRFSMTRDRGERGVALPLPKLSTAFSSDPRASSFGQGGRMWPDPTKARTRGSGAPVAISGSMSKWFGSGGLNRPPQRPPRASHREPRKPQTVRSVRLAGVFPTRRSAAREGSRRCLDDWAGASVGLNAETTGRVRWPEIMKRPGQPSPSAENCRHAHWSRARSIDARTTSRFHRRTTPHGSRPIGSE